MGWFILKQIFSTLLAILNVRRLSDQEKDLEILVLRQQLSIGWGFCTIRAPMSK